MQEIAGILYVILGVVILIAVMLLDICAELHKANERNQRND